MKQLNRLGNLHAMTHDHAYLHLHAYLTMNNTHLAAHLGAALATWRAKAPQGSRQGGRARDLQTAEQEEEQEQEEQEHQPGRGQGPEGGVVTPVTGQEQGQLGGGSQPGGRPQGEQGPSHSQGGNGNSAGLQCESRFWETYGRGTVPAPGHVAGLVTGPEVLACGLHMVEGFPRMVRGPGQGAPSAGQRCSKNTWQSC